MRPPTQPTPTTPAQAGPWVGALAAFLGALVLILTAAVIRKTAPHSAATPWLPLLPAVVASLGVAVLIILGRRHGVPRPAVQFWTGCLTGAAMWAGWTIWQGGSLISSGMGILAFGTAALVAPAFAPPAPPAPGMPAAVVVARREESQWKQLIDAHCGIKPPGVMVTNIEPWKNLVLYKGKTIPAGFTLAVDFPRGSPYTFQVLQHAAAGLAAAKRLPRGCTISAEEGHVQGTGLLHVTTVHDTSILPFPRDYSPLSVRNEFPVGGFPDAAPTMIELYQASGIAAGMRGAGKTVLLQVITAMLLRCTDCIVIHIDLNGGGMSAPWIAPYARGLMDQPALHWVATGPEEALLVAEVLTRIAQDRKARYQHLLIENNTDVLPVSPAIPAIIVIVDEGGEVFGDDAPREAQQAATKLRQLQAIGRAMCVNVLLSTQRATATYIPAGVRKAAVLKMCGMVDDDSELAYLFDWARGLRAADLTGPGHGFIRIGARMAPRKFRWFHLLPAQIGEIAVATETLRPRLDAAAVRIGGEVYAKRWERARPWLQSLAGVAPDIDVGPAPYVQPAPLMTGAEAVDIADQVLAQLRGEPVAAARVVSDGGLPVEWQAQAAQLAALPTTDDVKPEPPDAPDVTGSRFVLDLIRQAGPEGVRTGAIFDAAKDRGLTVRRATVSRWIGEHRDAGRVVQVPREQGYATWTVTSHAT